MANPTLVDFANQNGLTTNYDPKTKVVTVTDPNTGKSIDFANGQGSEFGMGGLVQPGASTMSAVNTVANPNALLSALRPSQTATPQPTAPNNSGLSSAVSSSNAGIQSNADYYNNQRNQQIAALNNILNTENYTKILQNVIGQLMPSYNAGATQLQQASQKSANSIDADAERRGLFNSGAAASLQQQNTANLNQNLAALLADLQAQAVEQARQYVTQQLQGIGMQGDWTTSDRGMGLDELNSIVKNAGILDQSNIDWEKVGIDKQGMNNDFILGLGNLGVSQQNANTNAQQVANNYDLGIRGLEMDKQKLDAAISQFNQELQFKKDVQVSDMAQFAQRLKLDWAQLRSSEKSSLINAQANLLQAQIAQGKFDSEEKLIAAQNRKQEMVDMQEAYTMLDTIDQQATQRNWDAKQIRDAKLQLISPYEGYNRDLYDDLRNSIIDEFTQTSADNYSRGVKSGITGNSPINTGLGRVGEALLNGGQGPMLQP